MAKRGRDATSVVRVLMIGDSGVGKTSLVLRYDEDSFSHKFVTTIGVDYRDKLVEIDGKRVKLQIWDTAGQERFRSLTSNFFSRADGMVLTYDVGDRTSFEHLRNWMTEINKHAPDDVNIVVCGAKCDLDVQDRQVTIEEGRELAQAFSVPYFEASAKKSINVENMFMSLAEAIIQRKTGFAGERPSAVALPTSPAQRRADGSKKGGCC